MKIINESKKEKLPIDFITQFVSKGWDEVGMLKASKDAIKATFKETTKVEGIIQDLIDSYLVCIGQMELYLDKKDYLDIPEASELNEAANTDEDLKLQEDLELKNSGDFDVEVKQEDNKQQAEVTTLATSPANNTSIYDQRDEDRKTMNTNDNSTIGLEDKENYIYHNLVYDDELCNSIINSVFSNEAYGQKLKNALIEKHASLDVIYNEYGIPEVIFIIENKAYLVHAEDEYFVINKILDAENFNVDRTTNYVYLHY